MNLRLIGVALLGLTLIAYLIFYVGFEAVLMAALTVGWSGFAGLLTIALCIILPLGAAWHVLVEGLTAARLGIYVWARMVRDSAAEVLPLSQVGGFFVGARALVLTGISPAMAFGSTIVDVTTEMMAQIAYILIGIGILALRAPAASAPLMGALLLGVTAAVIIGGVFIFVQTKGLKLTERLADKFLPAQLAHATAVAAAVDAIYQHPVRLGVSFALHLLAWVATAGLTWLTFTMMGAEVDIFAVIAIDSLVFAARSATFFVPNALGIQEGAYALLAPMFGVGPELGIAASLLKRARDIAVGAPVLLIWQAMEGRRAFATPADANLLKPE